MESYEINTGATYSGFRWKGPKKVTGLVRHRGQEAVVHYINVRSGRRGHAHLNVFAKQAQELAEAVAAAGANAQPSATESS